VVPAFSVDECCEDLGYPAFLGRRTACPESKQTKDF
jgi:hypothetical protein